MFLSIVVQREYNIEVKYSSVKIKNKKSYPQLVDQSNDAI